MHLKNSLLFGLMAILLLGGTITPVLSQGVPDSILINEVEFNSPEGSEFVELYNPTSSSVDVSGWSVVPTATWKALQIPENTIIEPKSFLALTHVNYWFKDFGESVSLLDDSNNIIDVTPILKDQNNDFNSWQRSTDGLRTNSIDDWEFKTYTPNSSNGKEIQTTESQFSMTGFTDKTEYVFGDDLTLLGSVSELLYSSPSSSPEIIKVSISGPNYYKNLALFPARDLGYSTTMNLQKIYGYSEGDYTIKISYGDNTVETTFSIIEEFSSTSSESVSETVEIFTDKLSYIPGENVIISAKTNSSIEYAGLDYTVTDPNGEIFSSGTIFSNSNFSTVHQAGAGQIFPFSTKLLMHGINPVYGTYQIQGTFKAQDDFYRSAGVELFANTSFDLVEDVKEDSIFSLLIDKDVYSVTDTISVTGRSNIVWTENIDLKVEQTGVLKYDAAEYKSQHIRPDPFVLKESVYLNGDGTFEFEFKLFNNSLQEDASYLLGDYRLTVSDYFGSAYVTFQVVEDPESFVDIRSPLGLQMDKSQYVIGTAFSASGKILDYVQRNSAIRSDNSVEFTITDSTGKSVMSEDRRSNNSVNYEATSPNDKLRYTALPDSIGNYYISAIFFPIQFETGKYTLTAHYPVSGISESVDFEIITAQSEILTPTESKTPLEFELCSSTANIETIQKDYTKFGKGETSASMETIDCDGITDFKTGEKLVIIGKVALKETTALDQSSVRTSGQTQQGHSYSTNYAQSEMNFIELAIPYPQSLLISGAYRTTDDTGQYHGGGGTGGGGVTTGDSHDDEHRSTGIGDSANISSDRSTGYDGRAILMQKMKHLTDMNLKAYPDDDGNFYGIFDLRAGIFDSGIYNLKATYFGHYADESFLITDDSLKGGKPELVLDLDREEYIPGETVSISGTIKNVYYFDTVSLLINTPDVSKINCLVGQQCGFGNTEKKLRVTEGNEGAKFFMNFKIPTGDHSLGKYTVMADTHFGSVEKTFFVIDESDVVSSSPESISKKIIKKFNRISDDQIPISLTTNSSDDPILVPRVIQGSLFTPARGEESSINLRITTSNGQCVIGQDSDCLVSESTRKPGEIYSIVSIDDVNYKVRYSGSDVRLEKFSILPEDSTSQINIEIWNVEIVKDQQPTRFYYKVSYVALE